MALLLAVAVGFSFHFLAPETSAQSRQTARSRARQLVIRANKATDVPDWRKVIALCTQAISIDPTYARAYVFRAQAYEKFPDKRNAAIGDYQEFLRRAPADKIPADDIDVAFADRRLKVLRGRTPTPTPTRITTPTRTPKPARTPTPQPTTLSPEPPEGDSISLPPASFDTTKLAVATRWAAHAQAPGALAFSPDGRVLASGGWKTEGAAQISEILVWDVASGAVQTLTGRWQSAWNGKGAKPPWIGHFGKVNALAFSPDSRVLASGGEDGRVMLWKAESGEPRKILERVERPIAALCWLPSGQLAGLSRDGVVVLWNAGSGKRERNIRLAVTASGDWVRAAAFSRDGRRVATGDADGDVSVWDTASGRLLRRFRNSLYQDTSSPAGVQSTALTFSPDGAFLASAHYGHVYLDAVERPASGASPAVNRFDSLFIAGERIGQLAFSPDGKTLAALGERKVFLLDPTTADASKIKRGELAVSLPAMRVFAFSPRAAILAGGGDGEIRLWKAAP